MRLLIAISLVCLSLAGCGDAPAKALCDSSQENLDDSCIEVQSDRGLIRGIIVDNAIVPLPGVLIKIVGAGEEFETTSDEGGAWRISDLAPGTYRVTASKLGYTTQEFNAVVEAGVVPGLLKIQLTPIAGFHAFANPFQWDGYIQCNSTYANACLIINYYPQALLGQEPLLQDESIHVWWDEFVDVGRSPDLLQVETIWKSTQPLGSSLNIRYEVGDLDSVSVPCVFGSQEGESPQIYRINYTQATDAGLGAPDTNPDDEEGCDEEVEHGFAMEFFSGDAVGACQQTGIIGCHPRVGATVEQSASIFLTAFYDYLPPEDWTFWETGAVPPPQ